MGLILLCVPDRQVWAQDRQPLLIPGKQTLFQRVLTRPDAPLTRAPDGEVIETLAPFELFYVYGRSGDGDAERLEVGRSLSQGPEGWLPVGKTIAWKHAMVLGFTNPANRERALIYRNRQGLMDSLGGEDVVARLARLRREAQEADLSPESPVISIEPAEHVDIEEEFYVLPILEADDIRLPNNKRTKLLRVASVPKESGQVNPTGVDNAEALRDFRLGVVFVIDTTRSMQPYIDVVRKSIERLRDRIAGSEEGERFRFGLIGFRDSTDLAPDLEYVTRTFLPLDEDASVSKLADALSSLQAAQTNSNQYQEDSLAGITSAVEDVEWGPFGGRYVILITDAGPRVGIGARNSALAPRELQAEVERSSIATFVLHLRTEQGSFDHTFAEESYRSLARFSDQSLYFPVQNGSLEAFSAQVDSLATKLLGQAADAMSGEVQGSGEEGSAIEAAADRVGRAMQLAYLGRQQGTRVPDVFEGWLTQDDPLDRRARPVRPYLLMSRNDLSTLRDVLRRTIELGISSSQQQNSADFFSQLRDAVALIVRNPDAVADAGTLGDLLGEYLEDLPYNSEIINLTPEDWRNLPPVEERQKIDTLRSKVRSMERIAEDPSRWYPIKPGAPEGEYITTVPLSLMP